MTIDLSLAGHGCTATYSLGPPGYRALPGEFLLQQLKTLQPLAALLPLCQSSAPQPRLQQVCLSHVAMVALKKDARACLGAAEVQVLVPF